MNEGQVLGSSFEASNGGFVGGFCCGYVRSEAAGRDQLTTFSGCGVNDRLCRILPFVSRKPDRTDILHHVVSRFAVITDDPAIINFNDLSHRAAEILASRI